MRRAAPARTPAVTPPTALRPAVLLALVLAAALGLAPGAAAQTDGSPYAVGHWRDLESEVFGQRRRVLVGTPPGYAGGSERYPVLYLMDGEAFFPSTAGLVRFLSMPGVDLVPQHLVVAVHHADRNHELTPPAAAPPAFLGDTGGADALLAFLRDELVPFVEAEYRTRPQRVLVGHSFGGLFALHALRSEPELFDAVVALSPSLQWDDGRQVETLADWFAARERLDARLFLASAGEGGGLTEGVRQLVAALETHTPTGLDWDHAILEAESHLSVVHDATRRGLESVYQLWGHKDLLPAYDEGGLAALHARARLAAERYGLPRELPAYTVVRVATELAVAGRLDEARQVLEHDPRRYPPPGFAYHLLAQEHEGRGDLEGAAACLRAALGRDRRDRAAAQELRRLEEQLEAQREAR